jgi:AmiR/NasT family two-component response regulator
MLWRVTTVLLIQASEGQAPSLAEDFTAAGFAVRGPCARADMVREALRGDPDVVVCWQPRADTRLIDALRTLQAQRALPVIVFTQDVDVEWEDEAAVDGTRRPGPREPGQGAVRRRAKSGSRSSRD